jgi:hypothetical protein
MNSELERVWKEAAVGYVKVLSRNLYGGTEENQEISARIAGLQVDLWKRNLPNTEQEC